MQTLLRRLEAAGLLKGTQGSIDAMSIDHLAGDSRKVGPNGLFVAVRGERADGHLFIDKAVKNGAIAIVCEAVPAEALASFPGTAFVHVTNTRKALAELAAASYGDPARALTMLGITGTNGKTTTVFLLHHLLKTLGARPGLIGTVEIRIGDRAVASSMTTPDALELNRLLREMVDAGCTACAMEVSSHALDQDRVHALDYDVALFSNLTQDHLDYHPSFQHYLEAKKKLFDGLKPEATALYNLDDPAGPQMVADTRARRVSYGCDARADVRLDVLENRVDGLRLRLDGRERAFRLVGRFNAYNLAAAYGAACALGYDPEVVLDALADAPPVPGRFELLRFEHGPTVIVDYAHTPDALENVLKTVNDTKPASAATWCVFGCGGDRDASKRGPMGAIAEQYADYVIVTSDNPRTEDPQAILDDIRRGMARPDEARWIVDRRAAIREAAAHARPGDVVLIAGKGHETYQIIGTETTHFDDREEARRAFGRQATRVE